MRKPSSNGLKNNPNPLIHVFFILFSFTFIMPFLYVISVSLSNENALSEFGYKLIPVKFDLLGYHYVFKNLNSILDAYVITTLETFSGTFLAVIIMALCAYPLSRSNYKLKGPMSFFIFFTMLFNGGLMPTYILITQYLHLGNTLWVYILPSLANAFHVIIFRTFFQGLPPSLIESAKIDGAGELMIFIRIVMPLSKPVVATIALLNILSRWNDWYTCLIYIRDSELYTLQFLLQKILNDLEFLKQVSQNMPEMARQMNDTLPSESVRFAMCVVAAGPMLFIFPFFQKYFTKGLTVGAMKG